MKTSIRVLLVLVVVGAVAVVAGLLRAGSADSSQVPANNILARAIDIQTGKVTPKAKEPATRLSAGVVTAAMERMGLTNAKGATAASAPNSSDDGGGAPPTGSLGCANTFQGSGTPPNIRVNQDCTLRRQAEEWVGVNPRDFDNVLAGQNDSMVGFNHCGYDWSVDHGKKWGSVGTQPPPFYQTVLQDGHTADACSDPAGTFDHLGNAYATGVLFDVASPASAIPVVKSNWPNRGLFWHTAKNVPFQEYTAGQLSGPASDNDPNIFHDKELMVGDTRPNSPKKGRVYITWTRFNDASGAGVGANSPIVFSQSTDGGATWSPQVIISGSSTACTDFSGSADPNACDQDQGSHPVVGKDGTIYVIFGNGNTPLPGINQVMMVKCPPTAPGSCNSTTDWQGPFRVGTLNGTHPTGAGDPNGCPTGRQCLPPNGYRAPEFTSISISVDRNNNLYATWADHRNSDNNCRGNVPPATSPCDHDIFYSFSTNGGTTWALERSITPRSRLGNTAQWQPWHDVRGDGNKAYVAFYDRHYGNCESTGCNDITLATLRNLRSAGGPSISYRRITSSSMPNLTPATNPLQAGFLGDYMWVEVSHHNFNQDDVHIAWADTRPLPYRLSHQKAPEEDVYYAQIKGDSDGD